MGRLRPAFLLVLEETGEGFFLGSGLKRAGSAKLRTRGALETNDRKMLGVAEKRDDSVNLYSILMVCAFRECYLGSRQCADSPPLLKITQAVSHLKSPLTV